jgi:hypothetical protein
MSASAPLAGVRVYVAPGEGPDVADALGRELDVTEVDHLSLVPGDEVPGVLLLSAALVASGGGAELQRLPSHVAVLAIDTRGRRLAESAGRLFLAAEELAGEAGLWRGLRAAAAHARACLRGERLSREVEALRVRLDEVVRGPGRERGAAAEER